MEQPRATEGLVNQKVFESEIRLLDTKIDHLKELFLEYKQTTSEKTNLADKNLDARLQKMNELREEFSDMKGMFAQRAEISALQKSIADLKEQFNKSLTDKFDSLNVQMKTINDKMTFEGGSEAEIAKKAADTSKIRTTIIGGIAVGIFFLLLNAGIALVVYFKTRGL